MSRKISRPRRNITCTTCGRKTSTTYPPESGDLCLPCRARGKNLAPNVPDRTTPGPVPKIGTRSKHDLDQWLAEGGAA